MGQTLLVLWSLPGFRTQLSQQLDDGADTSKLSAPLKEQYLHMSRPCGCTHCDMAGDNNTEASMSLKLTEAHF